MGDEPYETLGEKLSLPPFLEPERDKIEQACTTNRHGKKYEKYGKTSMNKNWR